MIMIVRMTTYLISLSDSSLNPDILSSLWRGQVVQRSSPGHETVVGILRVDPGLERPSSQVNVLLLDGENLEQKYLASVENIWHQNLSGRGVELPLHQVHPSDHLSHGVLNLQKIFSIIKKIFGISTCSLVFISMK